MVVIDPCLQLFAIMECHSMTQSCSTFAIKHFWQIVYVLFNLPRLLQLFHTCYVFSLAMDSFINMPSCCRYACFVMHCFVARASSSPRCLHISVSAMLCFLLSLKSVNETCYVYKVAIISPRPFWLMVSKGLLSYPFSRILPCLVFPC